MARKKVLIEIYSCSNCKHLSTERVYTSDSFEDIVRWLCNRTKRKKNEISGYVEWSDDDPSIPKWCPIRVKEKK